MSNLETTVEYLELTVVEWVPPLSLRLRFNDEEERVIDFGPFLRKARHPEIRKYEDPERFRSFTFEHGHLHWNDYDLSFSTEDLYGGRI